MSHYAKVVNNTVVAVVVAEEDFLPLLQEVVSPGEWIQTSYNTLGGVHQAGGTPLRKNFAGVGFRYDRDLDAFIPPQPYASWILNTDTCLWQAPVEVPLDGKYYIWNEDNKTWDTM